MNYPRISIITPVYNGSRYLEPLIKSISDQNYPNVEHLIIDDGSDDEGRTVNSLMKFPHVRFWTRENRGQYATMNEGLKEATGEWVCFISADDLVFSNALINISKEIKKSPRVDGYYGKTHYIDSAGTNYFIQPFAQSNLALYKYFVNVPHCSVYLRREFLLENELWFNDKLKFHGDFDWFMRVLGKKPKLEYIDSELSKIRRHEEQTTVNRWDEIQLERPEVFEYHQVNKLLHKFVKFMLKIRYIYFRDKKRLRNG